MNFKEVLKNLLLKLGTSLITQAGLGGFYGWLAQIALKIVAKVLVKLGVNIYEHAKELKARKEYAKEISRPDITREERRIADKSFLGDD